MKSISATTWERFGVDVPITGYAMHRPFPTSLPRTFLYPGIYIAMGYGLPAAIGAKVAHPDRPVVAMAGDGSFLMNSMKLATLVHHDLPVVILVSNDNSLTSIRHSQESRFGATLGIQVTNPDFVKYAASFGIAAERIRLPEELGPAMQRALLRNRQPGEQREAGEGHRRFQRWRNTRRG